VVEFHGVQMSYSIIIRGPLGAGKTAVSDSLARELGAKHILIDQILDDRGLWDQGRESEFLAANDFAMAEARPLLERGMPVIFDGNFYWRSVLEDLLARLRGDRFVFTLIAPLSVCIERDSRRSPSHGSEAAQEVFAKSTAFDFGLEIDAARPLEVVVREIKNHIAKASTRSDA
jgi:predicted kinase